MESGYKYATSSGIPLKNIYTPEDLIDLDYERDLGFPGKPPYTRGPYAEMYRQNLWRIFELSGYGTPKDAGELGKFVLSEGGNTLMLEPDRTVAYCYDVDHPVILEHKDEVGTLGTPYMSLRDYEEMLDGIPLDKIFCHPGAGWVGCSPFVLACYFSVAERRGIPLNHIRGTGQHDFFLSYLSCLYKDQIKPAAGLRLGCDIIEFCLKNVPRWVPVSIAGYNARECGANAWQELAILLSNAVIYIDELLNRGLKIDNFARAIAGISVTTSEDFFESVAAMRAVRRMWYKLLKERYGAQDPSSLKARIHALTRGTSFTYQQPLNNVVRASCEALAAALGGVQSMGVLRYDEAAGIPTKESLLLAVRTQQILQYETNIQGVIDPLAGSYYVEWLTNQLETRAWTYFRAIEQQGGLLACFESGWLLREVLKGTVEEVKKQESGEKKVVGVNCFQMKEEPHNIDVFRPSGIWEDAMSRLERVRKERDPEAVKRVLDTLRKACASDRNVMPILMQAVQSGVTIGEVGSVFREVFGLWKVPSAL